MGKLNNIFMGKHSSLYIDVSDTVEKKVGAGTFRRIFPQLLAAISGSLFTVSDGMVYGWTAPYIPFLTSEQSHIKTTKDEAEWLETVFLFGALCGLPLSIYLVNSAGRKPSLLIASFLMLLAWIAVGLGNRMEYLFAAMFAFGICSNMAGAAAPMYNAEIAEQKIRGFLSSIIEVMVHLGCLIVYSVGPFLPFYATPIIGASLVILELLVFSSVPESPYFLLYKNKPNEARKSLQYFRPGSDIEKELEGISESVEIQKQDKGNILDIIRVKSNRKALLIMTVLNSGQQLCAYSIILMNIHSILDEAGTLYMDSSFAALLMAALLLIACVIGSSQVDKYGRKALLIVSTISTGICLLTLAIFFHLKMLEFNIASVSWIPIVAVMAYAVAVNSGIGFVPIVITSEIFPIKYKAVGISITFGIFLFTGIFTIQLYQFLTKSYGIYVSFYLFGFWSFVITIFTIFVIPETKGKSLEEIQDILSYQKLEEEDD